MIYYKANLPLSGMLAVDSQSIKINNIIFVLHSSLFVFNKTKLYYINEINNKSFIIFHKLQIKSF